MNATRRTPWVRLALACLVLGLGPLARAGDEAPAAKEPRPDVFPLSAVRPGMRGHGLTVKAGTRIERFEVEVLDVVRNHEPKHDLILVRCLGPEFEDHQIAQGMSGSPVFIDGRVAGALSYTWAWAKHAIGGVTPIESMLAEGERPLEGRPTGWAPPTPLRRAATDGGTPSGRDLVPIGTPLAVSGFSPAGRAGLEASLRDEGFTVCNGTGVGGPGSGSDWVNLDAPMEPGAALVADLVRGDYNVSAIGTCTFVDGDKVYGFGHPFNTLGETLIPMSVGYVYTIVASREIAFKLGGSIRPVGAIVQDRPSCVVGILGREAPMVPVTATFTNAVTQRKESFRFEVTANRAFFSRMVIAALRDAFTTAEATLGENTKRYRMAVKIQGLEPFAYEDVTAGFDGGFQRQMIGLLDRPLNHPTQRCVFESFDLDVTVEHRDRRAIVSSVVASDDEVRPGQEVELQVGLVLKDGGARLVERIPVRIPHDAPDGNYTIAVLGGDYVDPEVPEPVDIADLPGIFAAYYRSTELVVLLPTGRVDLDLDGRLLRNLPLSSMPRLVRSPGGSGGKLRPVTEKVRRSIDHVVADSASVTLRVVR